jgi:Glycosyl hydrolase family 95 catalytic domain
LLVTGPSTSPENWFVAPDSGKPFSDSMGPTCDRVLVYALLSACVEASEILGCDSELRATLSIERDKSAFAGAPPSARGAGRVWKSESLTGRNIPFAKTTMTETRCTPDADGRGFRSGLWITAAAGVLSCAAPLDGAGAKQRWS